MDNKPLLIRFFSSVAVCRSHQCVHKSAKANVVSIVYFLHTIISFSIHMYTHYLQKVCLTGALVAFLVPFAATAQTSGAPSQAQPTGKGTLIADVNIQAVVATTTDGELSGSFLAKSSFGSQEGVVYGLVARSKTDGRILDTVKGEGAMTLPEGSSVAQTFSYTIPTYLTDAADVFLTLYTPTGVTLAVQKVAEAVKGSSGATCESDGKSLTCTSTNAAMLTVSVLAGSPQGETVAEEKVALTPGKATTILFGDITKGVKPGRYVISGTVTENGKVTGKVVHEFAKAGPVARIMSISAVNRSSEGSNTVSATVYTVIARFATSTVYTLSLSSPGCGEVGSATVTKSVTELVFDTSCENGQLTVNLLENGKVVDTATSTFVFPVIERKGSYGFLGWGVLVLAMFFIIWFVAKKIAAVPAVGAVAFVLLASATFTPTKAEAGTYLLDGLNQIIFCAGGGGCSDMVMEYPVGGTITVPTSVTANSSFSVTIEQANPSSGGGNTSTSINCFDYADKSDGDTCDSTDMRTDVYRNGSAAVAGSAVTHDSTKVLTFTSGPSGFESVSYISYINALNYTGCASTWSTKCYMYLDNTQKVLPDIPIVSAPTVNIYFTFLDKLQKVFSAFAGTR